MIQILPFTTNHLNSFVPNKLSRIEDVDHVFQNNMYEIHTILDDNVTQCVMAFLEDTPRVYAGFFLVGETMNSHHALALRSFIESEVLKRNATKIWTVSQQDPSVENWHKFLGLSKETTVDFNGKTLDLWSRVWE